MYTNTLGNVNTMQSDIFKRIAAFAKHIGENNEHVIDKMLEFFSSVSVALKKAICYGDTLFLKEGDICKSVLRINNDSPSEIVAFDGVSIANIPFEDCVKYSGLTEQNYNYNGTRSFVMGGGRTETITRTSSNNACTARLE